MSREKRIEECYDLEEIIYMSGYGLHRGDCYAIANQIQEQGYRKQSKGEWVVEAYKGDEIVTIPYIEHQHDEPFCSRCGKYALLNGGEEYVASNFCPNCGAKMKGGEE